MSAAGSAQATLPSGARAGAGPARWRHLELSVGGTLLGAIAAAALLAPALAPADPVTQDLANALAGPSVAHPLGTDALGRDVLARLLFGARLSLGIGLAATVASMLLGTALGALAGQGPRSVDEVVMRATDVFLAFPGILLAVALAAVVGPSARSVVVALTVMGWAGYARLVRAEVCSATARDYVAAARALGVRPLRLTMRHLLPAAAPHVVVQSAFGLSGAIVAEASLSFLGLGPPPPVPSWGAMLAEGRALLVVAPHLILAPASFVLATVLAILLLADALARPAGGGG